MTRGGDVVGILITRLLMFNSDSSSGSRLTSLLFHWSFLHSLSWMVTDHCRRLNSAFKAGFLVIFHRLLHRFSRVFHINMSRKWMPWVTTWTILAESINVFDIALDSCFKDAPIAIVFCRSGMDRSPASREARNLGQ
jgi:hypothetical protein